MADPKDIAGWATIALGASQLLAPQSTAKVFGLAELDDQSVWLTRLLGSSYVSIGAMALDGDIRERSKTITMTSLAGNAGVTLLAASRSGISARTAVMVVGFVGGLMSALGRD